MVLQAIVLAVIASGTVLRFWTASYLWLDEAVTVNIARLPLDAIPDALLQDGAPPLYYFLMHLWIRIFGSGDLAVRSLSAVFSVATLPAIWAAGRRAGGDRVAWAGLLLLASSPFAVRYATEARMYSLVMLLVVLGYLALTRALERPSPMRLLSVALVAGCLSLTHYWSLYLLAVVAVVLAVRAIRGPDKRTHGLVLVALGAGGLLFVPWLPSFLFQLEHTGTPWSRIASVNVTLTAMGEWSGDASRATDQYLNNTAPPLRVLLFALVLLGLFGRAMDNRRIELDLRGQPRARGIAIGLFGTLAVALTAASISQTGFVARYTSLVFPLFILLAALGIRAIASDKVRNAMLGAVVVLGLVGSTANTGGHRSQAGQAARLISSLGSPGDIVVYCPDQLGPAVSRLLPNRFDEVSLPAGSQPGLINWIDYEERVRSINPARAAWTLNQRAGNSRNIWLVTSRAYRLIGGQCGQVRNKLTTMRPESEVLLTRKNTFDERPDVVFYPSLATSSGP